MVYYISFFTEICVLFFISKKVINSLAVIAYKLTRSHSRVVAFLAILFLPGTIMHELAHMFTAGVMFVHVGEIDLVPEIQENGVKLGSVQIGSTDPFRRILIGVAPVIFGILTIFGIIHFIQSDILSGYFIFEVGNTMFSSKKDMEGALGFLLAILITALLLFGFLIALDYSPLEAIYNFVLGLNLISVENFFRMSVWYLFIPIILDLCVVILAFPFTRRR